MRPSQQIRQELERCGSLVFRCREDGWESTGYRALIQPLRYKNKMYLEGTHTPIGLNERGYYMYIGPAEQPVGASAGEWVRCGAARYEIDRVEHVDYAGEAVYYWAILRNETEAEE